jgi:hypothetical protein
MTMCKTISLLGSLAFLSIMSAAMADDPSVKTAEPPYKPGRQIDEDSVKVSKPPYKPGREIEEVKTAKQPYKPGREADEEKSPTTGSKD